MSLVGEISDLATAIGNKIRDLTIPVSKLSDATTLTRTILQRTTGAQIRGDIGAGTSDLALGSTGTTAAAGNHTHTAAALGVADVEGSAVGIWLGPVASLPGTGTTGYVYFTY